MRTEINKNHVEKLQHVFAEIIGKSQWDSIVPLTQGMAESSLGVYKISFSNQHYVAKFKKLEKMRELMNEFQHMKSASDLNVCPKLHYANVEEGLCIVDYVENQPMKGLVNGDLSEIQSIAKMLSRLHNQATFAKGKSIFNVANDIFSILRDFYRKQEVVAKGFEIITELKSILDDENDFRACHRELHQANLLFDGKNYLAIDWEPSGVDSFYVDLAGISVHFLYKNPDYSVQLLHAYLEREPEAQEIEKLHAMSTVCYLFYGLIFLASSLREWQKLLPIQNVEALPKYAAFLNGIGKGENNLADPNVRQQFGFIFLREGLKMKEAINPLTLTQRHPLR